MKGFVMGMDVYGIGNPEAYFRANIWSWRPIYSLIKKFASDLVDDITIEGMTCNDGHGLYRTEDCITLANRIENWMEHNTDGLEVEMDDKFENFIESIISSVKEQLKDRNEESSDIDKIQYGSNDNPKCKVEDDHLKEFIDFLRICEGFKVL